MDSTGVDSFTKQVACPSSKTLLSYRLTALSAEVDRLVEWHLNNCDFCSAELQLLAFYCAPGKGDCRTPPIPVNLRVLAEALFRNSSEKPKSLFRAESTAAH